MAFENENDSALPEYIKKQAPVIRAQWITIFNSVMDTNGEELAFVVANKWLLRQVSSETIMARTEGKEEKVSLVINDYTQMISRTEDGNTAISFKLADVFEDKFGVALPEWLLKQWHTKINSGQITGDIDHETYDKVLAENLSAEETKYKLENKKGIAKSIKAVYDKGKLWVKAIIDKSYEDVLSKTKGVSYEASIVKDDNGSIIGGDLYGFTFGVNHNPAIEGTEVHTNATA